MTEELLSKAPDKESTLMESPFFDQYFGCLAKYWILTICHIFELGRRRVRKPSCRVHFKLSVLVLFSLFLLLFLPIMGFSQTQSQKRRLPLGPFPIKTSITDNSNARLGEIHTYPEYAEVFDQRGEMVYRAGKLSDKGQMKIYIMGQGENLGIPIAFALNFGVYDMQGRLIGSYFNTPTYSFIYNPDGKRLGRFKCLAWSDVCASAGALVLNLANKLDATAKPVVTSR